MPWLGSQCSMGFMLRALVYDTSIGGLMIGQCRASNLWWYFHWSPLPWPTVPEEGYFALIDTNSLLEAGVPG